MSYVRFFMMILTSTLIMLGLMYLNTYAWEHVFFSETRVYMAILMGASMAIIMLVYMLGMYSNKRLNIAIFTGAAIVFGVALWMVRSQVTVSGPSYMRAMIPHHSIAVMTSERARIRDQRVRKLADEIIAAQRREIAEMRYLAAEVSSGSVVRQVYRDPSAMPGSVQDALDNTLISQLDLAPLTRTEAGQVLEGLGKCTFKRSAETDPILWATDPGSVAAVKLNGILIELQGSATQEHDALRLSAPSINVSVNPLGEEADWRSNAELVFRLKAGLEVGYRGFYNCS